MKVRIVVRRTEDALVAERVVGTGFHHRPVAAGRQPGDQLRGLHTQRRQQRLDLAKGVSESSALGIGQGCPQVP